MVDIVNFSHEKWWCFLYVYQSVLRMWRSILSINFYPFLSILIHDQWCMVYLLCILAFTLNIALKCGHLQNRCGCEDIIQIYSTICGLKHFSQPVQQDCVPQPWQLIDAWIMGTKMMGSQGQEFSSRTPNHGYSEYITWYSSQWPSRNFMYQVWPMVLFFLLLIVNLDNPSF